MNAKELKSIAEEAINNIPNHIQEQLVSVYETLKTFAREGRLSTDDIRMYYLDPLAIARLRRDGVRVNEVRKLSVEESIYRFSWGE